MIRLLVLDVDGCLSDGRITYTSTGEEIKAFHVKDGLAMEAWGRLGGKIAIITGRTSAVVERRAKELGVSHLHQGVKHKVTVVEEILKEENLTWENVAALGDDLNDRGMLMRAGWSFTPKDGAKQIRTLVHTILTCKGGRGAAREMIECILEKEGREKELEALWL
ncbi:MAG: HAD hydrolase family protein [Campylobacterales bacterium]|nr:HAD hydrolase family protein [Campylobacterales bacterium]